jgi:glycerol-3-phosphate acyltransferase PlsY
MGHCFPVFFRFKGGKGVATAVGAAMGTVPVVALILLAVFAVIVSAKRIVSLASGICAAIYPVLTFFLSNANRIENFIFSAACSSVIIILHIPNFIRLIDGEEKTITDKLP